MSLAVSAEPADLTQISIAGTARLSGEQDLRELQSAESGLSGGLS